MFIVRSALFLRCYVVIFVLFIANCLVAQSPTSVAILDEKFKTYEVLSIDSKEVLSRLRSQRSFSAFTIELSNGGKWVLDLEVTPLIGENYSLTVMTDRGLVTSDETPAIPMKGKIVGQNNSEVALTFNDNFVYGYFRIGIEEYFIEPMYHLVNERSMDKYVVYNPKDVKILPGFKCGSEHKNAELKKFKSQSEEWPQAQSMMACIEVPYNTASDWSMVVKYGNATGVANHNIGVLNNVQTNYDNEFTSEVRFTMGQQWVSACSTCDPWTTSTDSGVLLDSFTDWAQAGGFNTAHQLAGMWTNRNMLDGVVGIAWLGVMCTSFKYHVLSDFTSNATSLRVMTSHEIGHNFNAQHDNPGSGFIMAPSVNGSNTWSTPSKTAIQNHYNSATCLPTCVGSGSAPSAQFNFTVVSSCVPGKVNYFDVSTGGTTRSWSFPGGSPATSTAANPVVTYNAPGIYGATLTVSNTFGSNQMTVTDVVSVINFPISDFTFSIVGSTVNFSNTGSNGDSFLWNFGNGQTSTLENPSHVYAADGTYSVTLTTFNNCGQNVRTRTVVIATLPIANFSANVTAGCQPLSVTYNSLASSNTASLLWTFEGGTPPTSTLANPTVIYATPGVYDVNLRATNAQGQDNNFKENFITVNPLAVPVFSVVLNQAQATFTNASQFATSYLWNFGDGTTSTTANPVHAYTSNGSYIVTLAATNACGTVSTTQTVTVALAPIPSFTATNNAVVCEGQSVSFESNSSFNPVSYAWVFEGGNPATSTEANPTVTYASPGTFDVTLTVTNDNGSNVLIKEDYVTTNPLPNVSFTHMQDGLSISFVSTVVNGSNPVWNFGDGTTSNENNPSHVYNAEGDYEVTLTVNNDCGPKTTSKDINITLLPTAAFTANTQTICSQGNVNFINQSSPSVTSWSWIFEGGTPSTSNVANPVITYNTPGQYKVTLAVTNIQGTTTIVADDFIEVITVPQNAYNKVVEDNLIRLVNTVVGIDSVEWFITSSNLTTLLKGFEVLYTAPKNGMYIVQQKIYHTCGTATSEFDTITIDAFPKAIFSSADVICVDSETKLISRSNKAQEVIWNIEDQDEISGDTITIVLDSSRNYTFRMIAKNALGSDTTMGNLFVQPKPKSGFEFTVGGSEVQFLYTGDMGNKILWEFGDGQIDSISNPTNDYAVSGQYIVKQTSTNVCGKDSTEKTIAVIGSSSQQWSIGQRLLLLPNPSQGIFTVQILSPVEPRYQVLVYDVLGRIMDTSIWNVTKGTINSKDFDASSWPDGVYTLKIIGSQSHASQKIVISH